jgi:signal transduction histidine kinase
MSVRVQHRLRVPRAPDNARLLSAWLVPAAIAVVGLAATAVVAAAGNVPAHAAIHLLIYSVVGALAAGLAAAIVLSRFRHATVTVQAAIAALAPILAVAIGVTWAASEMFLMNRDLWVLWVVLTAAGTAGVVIAVILGRRVAAASREVAGLARHLGTDEPGVSFRASGLGSGSGLGSLSARRRGSPGGPGELRALARELESTSQRLHETRERAERGERSRRELVAWVSHDLRTPLAGIRAMIEALEDGVVAEPDLVSRYHASIRAETDRLSGLVDDLFELSRIQAGALHLDMEPVPLGELVVEAAQAAGAVAATRRIDVKVQVDGAPTVEVGAGEIMRVLRNLLDNAVRHTPEGGTVVVTAAAASRAGGSPAGDVVADAALALAGAAPSLPGAAVSVCDGCGGIPADVLTRVFDPGYRGDRARTPGDARGGLGLAVARGLVDAHHGEITVANTGPGCCFTVWLPLRA